MPTAKLVSKETITNQSLTAIVERSQSKPPPLQDYDIRLTSDQLEFAPISRPNQYIKPICPDEGFESDIDTVSIISSDDSTCLVDDHVLKTHRENDSANGSSSSESDTETAPPRHQNESFPLPDVLCYTDVNFPKVLLFCIKDCVYVFSFDDLESLRDFYTNFNTLKAVTNQRTYCKNLQTKFNLLHRTDQNGVTHIEISREPGYARDDSARDLFLKPKPEELKKVWRSAEDLLDAPKRPERKKKPKGRAPQPPVCQDVMKGQFVRVSVDPKRKPPPPTGPPLQNLQTFSPNWAPLRQPLVLRPAKPEVWTNSVPRLLKPRSRSESRTPMAYRYIDTTARPPQFPNSATISNRLFGLSQKLKEFSTNVVQPRSFETARRGSLGERKSELKSVIKKEDGKRTGSRGLEQKKVTFSAYATVQVV